MGGGDETQKEGSRGETSVENEFDFSPAVDFCLLAAGVSTCFVWWAYFWQQTF
jgi:hypothetical protein